MTLVLLLAIAIGLASIGGAAYLLKVWHEDADAMKRSGATVSTLRTWPFSRVLAYVAVACTVSSNFLVVPTLLRLINFPNFREIGIALTPFTITALLILDGAFVVIALYLRIVRSRS